MRELTYDTPVPVKNTTICRGFILDNPDASHYSRFLTVSTLYGFVTVVDFNWKHNHGRYFYTEFSMIIDGMRYSATLQQGGLSDRQIKWLSTNFSKTVVKRWVKEVLEPAIEKICGK